MKDVPKWDPKKPYWDQELSTIDFYRGERNKIINGVNIGGYQIHPWLYFHLNFFKTPVLSPGEEFKTMEKLMNPPMDDNVLYVIETYQEAEEKGLGMCMFGTRGFAKSTLLASLITWLNTTRVRGSTSVIGGDDQDLGNISFLLSLSFNNIHAAFLLPRLATDWDKEVEFGWKQRDSKRMTYSKISIVNARKGGDKESEKGAGSNPVGFIMDEIGKFNPKGILQSALPSFNTQYGAKLVHVLSGTGGNEELSESAREILSNPQAFKLLMMNWDRLDRSVPEEAITWKGDRKKKFGTFVPAHMSYRLEVPKVVKKLGDFLEMPHPDLNRIMINTTDWVNAAKVIQAKIDIHEKEEDRNKERMYYPRNIDDCFLTDSENPFPVDAINKRIDELESLGKVGKSVEIYKDQAVYKYKFSKKQRSKVKHPGGVSDAPTVLYGELPDMVPQRGIFVSGFDGYKQDLSGTDSLGSLYILKRRNMGPNEPCETIHCSYTARPYKMKDFNRTAETLIECWDAECCMESADLSFKQYLDQKGKAEQILCPPFSFTSSSSKKSYKLNSRFGLYPTGPNNEYRMNLFIDWCKEEYDIDIDDDGVTITKTGVDFIDDIDLLKEMRDYHQGGNFDRITAFSHALVYARELDKKNVRPRKQMPVETDNYREKKMKMGTFSNVRHNPF